jgi:hypothetical protein
MVNFCDGCFHGGGKVVGGGSGCGDGRVLALMVDFRKVMITSSPELAHCAPPLS